MNTQIERLIVAVSSFGIVSICIKIGISLEKMISLKNDNSSQLHSLRESLLELQPFVKHSESTSSSNDDDDSDETEEI